MKALKKTNFVAYLLISLLFVSTFAASVNAVGVTPALIELEADPGTELTGEITVKNSADTVKNMVVDTTDVVLDPLTNVQQFVDYDAPKGLKKWLTIDYTSQNADPEETVVVPYTIKVPEDADPGVYYGGITAKAFNPSADDAPLGVTARAVSTIVLIISGEFVEDLEIVSFDVNPQQLLKGNVVFETKIKNNGTVKTSPTGTIRLFNEKGEQVQKIYALTQDFESGTVVTDRKDEIPFNQGLDGVLPDLTKTFSYDWQNRNISAGKYTAKLEAFYGDGQELSAETEFSIEENFLIEDFKVESYYNSALPVNFSAKLRNTGGTSLEPGGYFEIRNIFGISKKRVDFAKDELTIAGGEEKEINNLSWENGFAMGLYSGFIELNVGGKVYTASTTFLVLNIWQILISLLVLVILIFIIYKGVKSYSNMKKKLEKMEEKK